MIEENQALPFRCEVQPDQGRLRVALFGELDLAGAPALQKTFREVADHGDDVLVDCSGLTFLDSMGISVLVASCKRFRSDDRTFAVTNATGSVRRVLEISGLIEFLGSEPAQG